MRRTLFTTCLVVLLVQFDTTVVNLALHAIQASLGGGVAFLQGILDAYNVVYASLILTGATLADLYGRRRLLALGIGVFTAASLLCGLAPTATWLVIGRVAAGMGAALVLPGSLAVLRVAYTDAAARARAVGIWAGINGVAVAIGPVLGGVLVSAVGWRSIFLVAVPLGTLALALSLGVVRESADPQGRRLDLPGQVLAMLGIGALAVAAIGGQSLGWRSIPIVGAFLLAGVLLGGFICVEARSRSPLLPLDVFGNRALSGALGTMTATTFGMYGMLLLVPLYLQSVLAETPLGAGLSLVPLGLVFAVVSAPAGWLVGRVGARLPIAGGMALAGVGLAILAEAGQAPPNGVILVGMAIVGLALGLLTGPLMAVAVANVVPERAGLASGLVNVGRMLGATLGVAVLGSIFAALRHGGQDAETFVQAMRAALLVGAAFEWIGSLVALLTIAPTAAQGTQPRAQAAPTAGVRRYA